MFKTPWPLTITLLLFQFTAFAQSTLNWGTYIGGEFGASITDVAVSNGYVAVVGSTTSAENIAFGDNIHQSYLNNVAGEPMMLQDAYVALYTLEGELQWCTYFGGEASDRAEAVVFDGTYITLVGSTESSFDIASEGSFQENFGGGASDGFVAKFGLEGQLIWSSYIGGEGDDHFQDIVLNAAGEIWFTGFTNSTDYPLINEVQSVLQGQQDAVISALDSDGNLNFSSLLGGSQIDSGNSIAILQNGDVFIGGTTSSENLSQGNVYQEELNGLSDNFIAKLVNEELVNLTYFGGGSYELPCHLFTHEGAVFLTGSTNSSDGITAGSTVYQEMNAGASDGFFAEFLSGLNSVNQGSFIGGSGFDEILDASAISDKVNLIGKTLSPGLASPNAYQNEIYEEDVLNDFILYQFDLDGNYLHSTYLGGEGQDIGTAVWAISDTQVIFGGNSNSSGLATEGAHQEQLYSGWMHGYLGLMDFGVGIEEEAVRVSDLKIYPNPSSGEFRLQSSAFSEGEQVTISIYNMHGQVVLQNNSSYTANMNINLEALSGGVYEVLLSDGLRSVRERLMVR